MHVFVRKRLLRHPDWQLDAWGVPISQADALLTLMGGSIVPAHGLRLLGYRTSRDEIEATLHFWRYVGHLMGVQPRWYPANADDAVRLMFTSFAKAAHASGDDGAMLARSFVDAFAPPPGAPWRTAWRDAIDTGLQRAHVAWFTPPASRRRFGLPSAGLWRLAPVAKAPWVFARESVRRRSPRADDWLDRSTREATRRWLDARLGERRAEYRAVEQFTR
jgi:hypothetical protein